MTCMQSFIIGQRVWLTDYSGSGFITQDREVNQWSEMPNESSLLRSCFVELEFEGVAAWIKEIRRKIRHESKAPIIFFPAISPLNCLHFPAALGQILVIRLHCKIPQREREALGNLMRGAECWKISPKNFIAIFQNNNSSLYKQF